MKDEKVKIMPILPCEIEDRRFSRSCTLRANLASTEVASGTGIGEKMAKWVTQMGRMGRMD